MLRIFAASLTCAIGLVGQITTVPTLSKDTIGTRATTIEIGDGAEIGSIGISGAIAASISTIAGAPYSAQTETQRVQVLADGNRIERTISGSVARDSRGRVRREESLLLLNAKGDTSQLVRIEDPVTGVHWMLDAQTKTAVKMPFLQTMTQTTSAGTGRVVPPPPAGPGNVWFSSQVPPGGPVQLAPRFQTTQDSGFVKADLGTQTMEGVTAKGTRLTHTIPAGTIGNEQPITITTETWYSPDLKVLVMSKTNDPRIGETTYRLTNVVRSEPASSLFQVPDDYTVRDQPVNTVSFHAATKQE